jgi:hypothetical protein
VAIELDGVPKTLRDARQTTTLSDRDIRGELKLSDPDHFALPRAYFGYRDVLGG